MFNFNFEKIVQYKCMESTSVLYNMNIKCILLDLNKSEVVICKKAQIHSTLLKFKASNTNILKSKTRDLGHFA